MLQRKAAHEEIPCLDNLSALQEGKEEEEKEEVRLGTLHAY